MSCLRERHKRARKREKETSVCQTPPWLCSSTQPGKEGIHILTDESGVSRKGNFTQSDTLRCGSAEI